MTTRRATCRRGQASAGSPASGYATGNRRRRANLTISKGITRKLCGDLTFNHLKVLGTLQVAPRVRR